MLYVASISVLVFLIIIVLFNNDLSKVIFLPAVGILLILVFLIFVAQTKDCGYVTKPEIVSTEKYVLLNYQESKKHTYDDTEEIIINYQTKKGSFKINSDDKTEIITPENGTPKYVTVKEDKYFNYLTFFSEIRTTYIFSVN